MADAEFQDHAVANQILYDKDGNAVGVVLEDGTYRLQVESRLNLPRLKDQLPDPDSFDLGARGQPYIDQKSRLVTKSQISTDEGAFRDDFTEALESALTGTLTFAASTVVTGSGTAFTTELSRHSVIRLSSDAQNVAAEVDQIFSDTSLSLKHAYTGSASAGAATLSGWRIDAGTGMTVSQASSSVTVASGTTASSESRVTRHFHGPGTISGLISMDQRIANQELRIGFEGLSGSSEAVVVFDGTDSNQITLRSTSPGGTAKTSTYSLPVGEDTSAPHRYKVDLDHDKVRFFFDGIQTAEHFFHISDPYEHMRGGIHVVNTGTPGSSTDLVVDSLFLAEKTVTEVKVSGALDNLRVDAGGSLQVTLVPAAGALPLIVNPNFEASDGAIVAGQYKRVVTYTVPLAFDGWLIRYSSYQNETGKSRLVAFIVMGTYDFTPETFTAGTQYTAPQWSSVVEAEVTTALGSGGPTNVVVTVTYTNELGVGSRTGTITIPKSSIVGSRWHLFLQTGDLGLRSIQAVSDDGAQAGAIKIIGNIQLAYHNDLSSSTQVETNYQPGAIAFPSGTTLAIEYQGGSVSKDRLFDALIQFVAEQT